MNDVLEKINAVLGNATLTNALLAWVAIETRRSVPLLRALVAHFKIKLPRAATEPGDR